MNIRYSCSRYPYLKIGKDIHFEGGLFETEDETLQGLIQKNDSFGVHIHFVEDPETLARKAREAEALRMQGGFKSDESQDATRKYADRIGMEVEDAEALVVDKKEAVAEQVQEKLRPKRHPRFSKRGRKPKDPADKSWEG